MSDVKALNCPCCDASLIFRSENKTILHWYHPALNDCVLSGQVVPLNSIAAWNRRHIDEDLVRRVTELAREHRAKPYGVRTDELMFRYAAEEIIEALNGK